MWARSRSSPSAAPHLRLEEGEQVGRAGGVEGAATRRRKAQARLPPLIKWVEKRSNSPLYGLSCGGSGGDRARGAAGQLLPKPQEITVAPRRCLAWRNGCRR